jgi:hypothetical protein
MEEERVDKEVVKRRNLFSVHFACIFTSFIEVSSGYEYENIGSSGD